ncbi:MAG TPA: PLD nuclease N-terminal domain-containing protein [Thermoleophilaceae bacterium]
MYLAVSTAVWIFILVPVLVIWAVGLIDIFRRDLPRGTKAAWVLIVVLLPIVGTITYFVLRKPTEKEIRQAQQAAAARRGE